MQLSNRRWLRWVAVLIALILIGSLVFGGVYMYRGNEQTKKDQDQQQTANQFQPLDTSSKKVVAQFDQQKITEGELNRYINIMSFLDYNLGLLMSSPQMQSPSESKKLKTVLLKGYIAELQVAKQIDRKDEFQKKADQEMKKLDDSLKQFKSVQPNQPGSLAEAEKTKGFTKAELQDFITRNLQRNAYFEEQLKGKKYTKVKVQHVLVAFKDETGKTKRSDAEAKKRIDEVAQKLKNGEDFAKVAKTYSDDIGSKEKSGIVEGATDQFVPAFAKAAETLEMEKLSEPIKTEYGYHVLKVLARSEEEYSKASDELKQKKMQELNQEYIDQHVKAKITL